MRLQNIRVKYLYLLILSLVLLPRIAFGLAGFSEQDFEYYYSPKILIEFNVPSDTCSPEYDKNQQCIQIYLAQTDEHNFHLQFKNLDLMTELNLPQTSEPALIIGKSYYDNSWFIFDLKNDKEVLRDKSYVIVEQQWEKLGNIKPDLVNTNNFTKYFHNQTEDSKRKNNDLESFARGVLLTGLVGIVVVIGVVVGAIYLSKVKWTR